jgi:hypothetical protein
MRVKYWSYLLNDEGQPIENADIYVYLAGGTNPASIYTSDVGGVVSSTPPQIQTNSDGYFQFWIPDNNEGGYSRSQKFKIKWIKANVSTGTIDNISILPIGPGYYYDTIATWTAGASGYYHDVNHGLEINFPVVQCYNSDTKMKEDPTYIVSLSSDIVRIWYSDDSKSYDVVVIG